MPTLHNHQTNYAELFIFLLHFFLSFREKKPHSSEVIGLLHLRDCFIANCATGILKASMISIGISQVKNMQKVRILSLSLYQ